MYHILDIDELVFDLENDEALKAAEERQQELSLLAQDESPIVVMLSDIASVLLTDAIDDYRDTGSVHPGLCYDQVEPYSALLQHHFYRYLPTYNEEEIKAEQ